MRGQLQRLFTSVPVNAPAWDVSVCSVTEVKYRKTEKLRGTVIAKGWPPTAVCSERNGRPSCKPNLQVVVLVPLGVQGVPHSVCRVALSRTVHHHLGEGIGEACGERREAHWAVAAGNGSKQRIIAQLRGRADTGVVYNTCLPHPSRYLHPQTFWRPNKALWWLKCSCM